MIVGIADGLAHVRHALPGFVHADLKPENILVSADGLAKITAWASPESCPPPEPRISRPARRRRAQPLP